MAKVLDCGRVVNEFELQTRYYVHFWTKTLWKNMNPLIPPAMHSILPLLKYPTEVDMPLSNETKIRYIDMIRVKYIFR